MGFYTITARAATSKLIPNSFWKYRWISDTVDALMMFLCSEPFAVKFYDEIFYFWVLREWKWLVLSHVLWLRETFGFAVTFRDLAFCILALNALKQQLPCQVSRASVLQSGANKEWKAPGRATLGLKRHVSFSTRNTKGNVNITTKDEYLLPGWSYFLVVFGKLDFMTWECPSCRRY